MSSTEPLSALDLRRLEERDRAAVVALAASAGAPGVYVRNEVEGGDGGDWTRTCFGVFVDGALRAVASLGVRGSLILLADGGAVDGAALARAMRRHGDGWRIALGPPALVDALAQIEVVPPIAWREQVYYGVGRGQVGVADGEHAAQVRRAERGDLRALVHSTSALNQEDLLVDERRISQAWLRDSVRRRIADGSEWVIGPVGSPWCKLDIGSQGPGGAVIEGVYTVPERRGQGLATALVASVAAALLQRGAATVCLHVAAANAAAHRCYERAGMRLAAGGRCRLLLRG